MKKFHENDSNAVIKESIRELQIVFTSALGSTLKINGFGINYIHFELINMEETQHGTQMNLEAKGEAVVKSKEHLSRLLQKLVETTREPLWSKRIFLEMLYHEISTSEQKIETFNTTPMDLKRKVYFNVICAAIIFK